MTSVLCTTYQHGLVLLWEMEKISGDLRCYLEYLSDEQSWCLWMDYEAVMACPALNFLEAIEQGMWKGYVLNPPV